MPLVKPFSGLRPTSGQANAVAAPPYDVLSSEEARVLAAGKPWSFLHISKAEIDLPPGTDPYAPQVYAKARENLERMLAAGILQRDASPCYYAYRLIMPTAAGEHVQTGLVAAAAVADYDSNRIRKHEFTRPDKEDDRVRQIEALNAQTGPVLLAYPASPEADALLAQASAGSPDADVLASGNIRHILWVVRDAGLIAKISAAFDAMPALYIADGHHRSAAASRVAAARKNSGQSGYFLSVIFPHHETRIMDYNRVVKDLNGMSEDGFLDRLQQSFAVSASPAQVKPSKQGEFGLYLPGRWLRLNINSKLIPVVDPVARLDVSLLTEYLLSPILGIHDLRRDKRIDFVGGIRGLAELEKRVNSGEMAAAFALYPTQMQDLMAVADAGEVMPPKSTWFEPKLADGLVSHVLD
ncbi:MAG: DUF1015 domain-containing protein [Betaproteobacteria bacterium]|nr:DUF1015 domain-containing protein [Betaproteobacteria bacterium]